MLYFDVLNVYFIKRGWCQFMKRFCDIFLNLKTEKTQKYDYFKNKIITQQSYINTFRNFLILFILKRKVIKGNR